MDGKGRWVDNVFIERLWRSRKYEEVYLKAYTTPREAELEIGHYTWCFIMRSVTIRDSMTSPLMKPTLVGRDTLHELDQPLKKLAYVSNHWGLLLVDEKTVRLCHT